MHTFIFILQDEVNEVLKLQYFLTYVSTLMTDIASYSYFVRACTHLRGVRTEEANGTEERFCSSTNPLEYVLVTVGYCSHRDTLVCLVLFLV